MILERFFRRMRKLLCRKVNMGVFPYSENKKKDPERREKGIGKTKLLLRQTSETKEP